MITPPPIAAPFALLLQAAPGGTSPITPFVIEFGLIIAIIYFFMVRPQQKQRQKHEAALKALKKGDEVVTSGGIVGEVIHIRETSKDGGTNRLSDRVTIKSGESRLVVERGRIASIVGTVSSSSSTSSATPSS
jgi:preprotein translocase subunit YajC